MSIGSLIDELYELRATRKNLDAKSKELKAREDAIEAELIGELSGLDISQARGTVASFSFTKEKVPNVSDWDLVHGFVIAENDFSLLQKRISVPAWRENLEDGILVPGTEIFENTKSFLRKV